MVAAAAGVPGPLVNRMSRSGTLRYARSSAAATLAAALVTAAGGLLAIAASIGRVGDQSTLPLAAGCFAFSLAALLRPVEPAPGTKFTLAGAVGIFSAGLLPGAQAVAAIFAAAVVAKLFQRTTLVNLAVNASKAAGATGAASLVIGVAGTGVAALVLAGTAYTAITLGSVGGMVLATQGARSVAAFLARETLPTAALAATGLIAALLWTIAPLTIGLLLFPIAVIELAARANARVAETSRALASALDAQRAFSADAAHELRTPLTALRGNLAYLDESRLAADEREAFSDAQRDLGRVLALIERLLFFASVGEPEAGRPADLAACAQEALRSVSPRDGVSVASALPDGLEVAMPAELLRTVITDVIANAVAYTPAGEVSLSARAAGSRAVVTVRDTGIGMGREELERAFDRFYRGARARQLADGSGLGLAIVRRIVDSYGGRIAIASELGAGTTVTLDLPAAT